MIRRFLGWLRDRRLRRERHQWQAEKLADLKDDSVDPHWAAVRQMLGKPPEDISDRRRRRDDRH